MDGQGSRKKLSLNRRLRRICRYTFKREDKKQQTFKFLDTYIVYITNIYNITMLRWWILHNFVINLFLRDKQDN